MTNRERTLAVLNYQRYDRMPVVQFGFWGETLQLWADQGHLTQDEARLWRDGNAMDKAVGAKLGFDFNWQTMFISNTFLNPPFEEKVLEETADGYMKVLDDCGVIVLKKRGTTSIPSEIDHTLKVRKDWEEQYKHRLQYSDDRIATTMVRVDTGELRWDQGGLEHLRRNERQDPYGLHCGSLMGRIRDTVGVMGLSYMVADDEGLFREIVDAVGDLCYRCVRKILESGARFDFAHFWEDICFRGGPLVTPSVFEKCVGPHYKRITDLVREYGINIVSLDCDGCIDALIPAWFNNGVNTMFPIEVGSWDANIAPWRQKYGKGLLGVGGMNKTVLSRDFAAVDAEIERLRRLADLGGFLPCPDHRLAPDSKWDNVRYYCDRFRKAFGG